jgi:Ca-activated chloride channel family protein
MLRAYGVLVVLAGSLAILGCGARAPSASAPASMAMDAAAMESPAEGRGPGMGGDQYDRIVENPFVDVRSDPRSTFSIDVDTASYAKAREFLMEHDRLPPPDAVRIEEFVNYFSYDYSEPTDEHPFAVHVEVAGCPWREQHRLVRIGLQGWRLDEQQRPAANLVFLLDVSGSMRAPDKLPLVLQGMKMLVEQLNQDDRVAIVVYAGAAGLVLDSTSCDRKQDILDALLRLEAGGSTNGGEGIRLAYRVARDHFVEGGTNRVMLCTDGDFNVGTTSKGALVRLAEGEAKSGVFLSVLGFGTGNLNDAMLEQISNRADGNYAFIDSVSEARKVLVEQMGGTLVTIAKDVKIQVEFNPAEVQA